MASTPATLPSAEGTTLLSIPLEIRSIIYEEAFQGVGLFIDAPLKYKSLRLASERQRRLLPGLLRVSRQVRMEALPVFAHNVEPLFNGRMSVDPIPRFCLDHIRKLYIAQHHVKLRCIHKLPSLRVIVLEARKNQNPEKHDATRFWVDRPGKSPFDKLYVLIQACWIEYAGTYVDLCARAMERSKRNAEVQILLHFYMKMGEGLNYLVSTQPAQSLIDSADLE